LPQKVRERSTPSRINAEYGEKNLITGNCETDEGSKLQTNSTDQYHNYLNNLTWHQDSYQDTDGDNLANKLLENSKIDYEFEKSKFKKLELRSSSISSSKISLNSEITSSNELIGWSYQWTKDGKLWNMTKDFEWKQLYRSRYINERVEAELSEFKDEKEVQ